MRKSDKPSRKKRRRSKHVVLIVDGEPNVCRSYARVLKLDFGEVLTAGDPQEAIAVLEERSVTHLVCGRSFGPGKPLGMDLIPKWRKTYPAIDRALILTRSEIPGLSAPPEIDGILPKPITPESLVKALYR